MKKVFLAAGFLLATMTGAAMAQGYGYGPPYGYAQPYGYGIYDYAPGPGLYDSAPGYGIYGRWSSYGNNWYDLDRVDAPGRGNNVESQR